MNNSLQVLGVLVGGGLVKISRGPRSLLATATLLLLASLGIAAGVSETHVLAISQVLAASQETPSGAIQGTVTREGATDPLPNVQLTVLAKGSLAATGFTAQQILQAVQRGAAVSPELVQMAQDATRGGPRAGVANAVPLTAVSDSAGRFTMRNVPAGEHIVRAQLQNYFGPAVNGIRTGAATRLTRSRLNGERRLRSSGRRARSC